MGNATGDDLGGDIVDVDRVAELNRPLGEGSGTAGRVAGDWGFGIGDLGLAGADGLLSADRNVCPTLFLADRNVCPTGSAGASPSGCQTGTGMPSMASAARPSMMPPTTPEAGLRRREADAEAGVFQLAGFVPKRRGFFELVLKPAGGDLPGQVYFLLAGDLGLRRQHFAQPLDDAANDLANAGLGNLVFCRLRPGRGIADMDGLVDFEIALGRGQLDGGGGHGGLRRKRSEVGSQTSELVGWAVPTRGATPWWAQPTLQEADRRTLVDSCAKKRPRVVKKIPREGRLLRGRPVRASESAAAISGEPKIIFSRGGMDRSGPFWTGASTVGFTRGCTPSPLRGLARMAARDQ